MYLKLLMSKLILLMALQPHTQMADMEFKARFANTIALETAKNYGSKDRLKYVNVEMTKFCKEYNVLVSMCQVCATVYAIKNGGVGVSHGVCVVCVEDHFKMMGVLEEAKDFLPTMEQKADEWNKRNTIAERMS